MNDIFVTRDTVEEMQNFKGKLTKKFEIKDLGNLDIFLALRWKDQKRGSMLLKGSISLIC